MGSYAGGVKLNKLIVSVLPDFERGVAAVSDKARWFGGWEDERMGGGEVGTDETRDLMIG